MKASEKIEKKTDREERNEGEKRVERVARLRRKMLLVMLQAVQPATYTDVLKTRWNRRKKNSRSLWEFEIVIGKSSINFFRFDIYFREHSRIKYRFLRTESVNKQDSLMKKKVKILTKLKWFKWQKEVKRVIKGIKILKIKQKKRHQRTLWISLTYEASACHIALVRNKLKSASHTTLSAFSPSLSHTSCKLIKLTVFCVCLFLN